MILKINYPEGAGKQFEMFRYPAGEVQVRFNPEQLEAVRNADEVHIIARIKDGEIMGLAMLKDALIGENQIVTLFLPYLPYSRADRQFADGDCFGLHVFASHINRMDFEKIVTLDVHSDVAEIEFIGNLINVPPTQAIYVVIEQNPGIAILLPDKGSYNRYKNMFFEGVALHAEKKRDPVTGKFQGFTVPSKEAFGNATSVLIVDDICDGGGTFIGIAEAMKDYGLELNLYVTHGIFSKGLVYLRKYFKHIYTTDSFQGNHTSQYADLTIIPSHGIMLAGILNTSEIYKNAGGQFEGLF